MTGTNVYYIRHGETAWSLTGQHTGTTDLPLTAHGEDQARALAARLAGITFDHVLTSPRLRARRTCELAGMAGAAQVEPGLAEWDYGDYEGLRSTDIIQLRPGWEIYRDGCPKGETAEQITARADKLLVRLRGMPGNVALFSHGHFGQVFVSRWIGWPVAAGRHFTLDTGSLGILGFKEGLPDLPVIRLWNSV